MATEVMHSRMCSNILGVCLYQHYGRFSAESRNFLIHIMSHDSSYLHLEFGSLLIKDNRVLYPILTTSLSREIIILPAEAL